MAALAAIFMLPSEKNWIPSSGFFFFSFFLGQLLPEKFLEPRSFPLPPPPSPDDFFSSECEHNVAVNHGKCASVDHREAKGAAPMGHDQQSFSGTARITEASWKVII